MALWYLTRATGATALVLLTVTIALGIADVERLASPRMPRFVIDEWHRITSLLVCVLLAVHIGVSVLDGYAPIRLVDAFVPFVSAYRPLWLGLGAFALDLLLALIVTSLLRSRIGPRTWRVVHWAAYACWPVALLHGLGTGSDVRPGWMTWVSVACTAVIAGALLARLASPGARTAARIGGASGLAALLVGLVIWLPTGPMASGWAARAGTPPPKGTPTNAATRP